MSSNFAHDLEEGQEAETFVAQVFEDRGYKIIQKATGKFPDWDFACLNRKGEIKTVEIKYDRQAHRTGNFFLERKALEHSKADILIYCYGQPISQLYFLELPQTLVRLAPHPSTTKGGDQGDSGWLFSKRKFEQILKPHIIAV